MLAKHKICVNALCPGAIITDMAKNLAKDQEVNADIEAQVPLGHWVSGDDIAHGMLYLVSAEARYVTGSLLTIDSGWRAK